MSSTPNRLGAKIFAAKPVAFDEFAPTVAQPGICRAPVDVGAI